MGFATPQATSTIMAEITLANGAEGAEELFLPGEAAEGEMPEQMGFMPGSEGKHYTFIPQEKTPFSEKCTEYFSETQQQPKEQKSFDSKGEARTLSYKQSDSMRTKEFQVLKTEKSTVEGEKKEGKIFTKTDQAGRQTLQAPRQHPPATRPIPREMMQGKQMAKVDPEGEKKAPKTEKEAKHERKSTDKGEVRQQSKAQVREQQTRQNVEHQTPREQEKADERQKRDDQEEGFAEDEREWKQEDDSADKENFKVGKMESKEGAFEAFLNEESTLLTELFNMRVNHFDVLVLFIEVMKLSLKGREQERQSRMEERQLQLQHIQNISDNYKQQGKWQLFANLGSGVLSIVSGIAPIAGHMGGDWILDKLSNITSKFDSFKDNPDKFFKSVSKMTFAMSEMQKSTGQIQNTFAESSRSRDERFADLRRSDWEEDTRTMDELKDQWKNMENFLHQSLQMQHDTIRQLYS